MSRAFVLRVLIGRWGQNSEAPVSLVSRALCILSVCPHQPCEHRVWGGVSPGEGFHKRPPLSPVLGRDQMWKGIA